MINRFHYLNGWTLKQLKKYCSINNIELHSGIKKEGIVEKITKINPEMKPRLKFVKRLLLYTSHISEVLSRDYRVAILLAKPIKSLKNYPNIIDSEQNIALIWNYRNDEGLLDEIELNIAYQEAYFTKKLNKLSKKSNEERKIIQDPNLVETYLPKGESEPFKKKPKTGQEIPSNTISRLNLELKTLRNQAEISKKKKEYKESLKYLRGAFKKQKLLIKLTPEPTPIEFTEELGWIYEEIDTLKQDLRNERFNEQWKVREDEKTPRERVILHDIASEERNKKKFGSLFRHITDNRFDNYIEWKNQNLNRIEKIFDKKIKSDRDKFLLILFYEEKKGYPKEENSLMTYYKNITNGKNAIYLGSFTQQYITWRKKNTGKFIQVNNSKFITWLKNRIDSFGDNSVLRNEESSDYVMWKPVFRREFIIFDKLSEFKKWYEVGHPLKDIPTSSEDIEILPKTKEKPEQLPESESRLKKKIERLKGEFKVLEPRRIVSEKTKQEINGEKKISKDYNKLIKKIGRKGEMYVFKEALPNDLGEKYPSVTVVEKNNTLILYKENKEVGKVVWHNIKGESGKNHDIWMELNGKEYFIEV